MFEEIARGGYMAQARIEPSKRANPNKEAEPFKYDLRCYVYRGEIQLIAARLYQGQTTNFRTRGSGFAPVYSATPLRVRRGMLHCFDEHHQPAAALGSDIIAGAMQWIISYLPRPRRLPDHIATRLEPNVHGIGEITRGRAPRGCPRIATA